MRLTDLQIKKLKAPERGQKTYFDEGLPGFGVRVSQGGTKSFVVVQGKDRRLRTIGRYPDMALAEARIEAKRTQVDMLLDVAPSAPVLPSVSFEQARARFLADSESRNKPRTVEEYRRLLERHFPFDKPLAAITRGEIMAVIEGLKSIPSEQKHAFVAMRTLLNWCLRQGLLEASPLPRLSFAAEARSRVLTDTELRAVWLRGGEVGHPYGTIVQLLILTGQRRGEIAGLRRSWIEGDEIAYPIGFTKNKRAHRVPLGPRAQAIVTAVPPGTDLLFPARYATEVPLNGWSKCKLDFDRGITVADYTLHDLRRTFSSNLARQGVPVHVTERLLNHATGSVSGVAAVYNRYSYAAEMRAAIEAYEAHLLGVIVGEGTPG